MRSNLCVEMEQSHARFRFDARNHFGTLPSMRLIHFLFKSCFVGCVAAFATAQLKSDTITIRPVADTSLFENNPDDNLGRSALAAGTIDRGSKKSRALIKFDPSASIPAGAKIESVRFTVRVTKVPPGRVDSMFGIHKVLKPWGEGNKSEALLGGAATAGEATWNARQFPTELWAAPGSQAGTDYVATATASRSIAGLASYPYESNVQIVSDVQSWLDDPSNNFGWILISASEGSRKSAKRFGSRETTSTSPSMIIEFTPAATATAPEITIQPAPQTVPVGGTATFRVEATGTAPLRYQWIKGTTPIDGATNVTLTLSNVTTSDAGSYSVTVSNAGGAKPSAGAQLTVTTTEPDLMPAFTGVDLEGGNIVLRFLAKAGNNYAVEFTDFIPTATWATLTNVVAALEPVSAVVPDPLTSANRYYRLKATVAP